MQVKQFKLEVQQCWAHIDKSTTLETNWTFIEESSKSIHMRVSIP